MTFSQMQRLAPFRWYRLRNLYCDWCEKDLGPSNEATYFFDPTGGRFLIHKIHLDEIRDWQRVND